MNNCNCKIGKVIFKDPKVTSLPVKQNTECMEDFRKAFIDAFDSIQEPTDYLILVQNKDKVYTRYKTTTFPVEYLPTWAQEAVRSCVL